MEATSFVDGTLANRQILANICHPHLLQQFLSLLAFSLLLLLQPPPNFNLVISGHHLAVAH